MLLQELKEQVYKLSLGDRLALISAIVESIEDKPKNQSERSNAISRMRGLLKTNQSSPTDEEVKVMLEKRIMEKYF
ncbi:MAG TPA: hypothetical protein V6C58_11200 [Allocoleopsis sp.]